VSFSMPWQGGSCEQAGGDALAALDVFRRQVYRCLWRRGDAQFELADAVLTAGGALRLPYLSLEPGFRRSHGMVYQALAEGRVGPGLGRG
jgi:hypothetical protein